MFHSFLLQFVYIIKILMMAKFNNGQKISLKVIQLACWYQFALALSFWLNKYNYDESFVIIVSPFACLGECCWRWLDCRKLSFVNIIGLSNLIRHFRKLCRECFFLIAPQKKSQPSSWAFPGSWWFHEWVRIWASWEWEWESNDPFGFIQHILTLFNITWGIWRAWNACNFQFLFG